MARIVPAGECYKQQHFGLCAIIDISAYSSLGIILENLKIYLVSFKK